MDKDTTHRKSIKVISGWGNVKKVPVKTFKPKTINQITKFIRNSSKHSIACRGLGRSYGDAAQLNNSHIIDLKAFNKIKINSKKKIVTCGAGVSFKKLLEAIIPAGFFVPVTAGTKNITIGGAIAADVHGKNHHKDGSFGNYIKIIKIIDGKGILHILDKDAKNFSKIQKDYFWGTIGGMGLTGIIVEASFQVFPISTSYMNVDSYAFKDLDSLMNAMTKADNKYKYSVAWIDAINKKGRGILTCGDHLDYTEFIKSQLKIPLSFNTKSIGKAPKFIPIKILNFFTLKLFNEFWFRKSARNKKNEIQSLQKYFYPLDGIENWNNLYGQKGFIQYQFAVPDQASFLIKETLNLLRQNSIPVYLTVLKRFGKSNSGLLTFPKKGWSLAIDMSAASRNIYKILDKLDILIQSNGGNIYLAKDSRMSKEVFEDCYPKLNKFKKIKNLYDPNSIFYSDLAKRLFI